MTDTLIVRHWQPTEPPRPNRQGRSKKALRMKLAHDGRVFIARWEGRAGFCFGLTEKEATYNLRSGQ